MIRHSLNHLTIIVKMQKCVVKMVKIKMSKSISYITKIRPGSSQNLGLGVGEID